MNKAFENIDESQYLSLLKKLLNDGKLYNKSSNRYVHKWPSLVLCTEDDTGAIETTREVDPDIYILFDPNVFKDAHSRQQVLGNIISSFSTKLYEQKDLNSVDWQGPDVYTMDGKKFRADYDIDPKNGDVAIPNANAVSALRLCIDLDESINWPCQWGPFPVAKGGTIAISQDNVDDLEKVIAQLEVELKDVDDDEVCKESIRKALYQEDGNARFDIYGMKPGFRIKNYDLFNKEKVPRILNLTQGSKSPRI